MVMLKVAYLPAYDLINRTIAKAAFFEYDQTQKLYLYLLSVSATLSLSGLMVYLVRMFNVFIPTTIIPWSAPQSKVSIVDFIVKLGLVFFASFYQNDRTFLLLELIALLLC